MVGGAASARCTEGDRGKSTEKRIGIQGGIVVSVVKCVGRDQKGAAVESNSYVGRAARRRDCSQ